MAIEIVNVGGIDYPVRDSQSREQCADLYTRVDNKPHVHAIMGDEETTNYYKMARGANIFFIWRADRDTYPKDGCLMETTRAVVKGEQILNGYNCKLVPTMHAMMAMDCHREGNDLYWKKADGVVEYVGDFPTLNTPNWFLQPNVFERNHTPTTSNWTEAQVTLSVSAEDVTQTTGRATICFHNNQVDAGQLYLDLDGTLKFLRNDGKRFTITMSEIS